MTRRWFSKSTKPQWSPREGYNELFAQQVRNIREWFDLAKYKPGVEYSTGTWRKYTLQGALVYITVDQFTWMEHYIPSSGETPVFKLNIRIARYQSAVMNLIDKIRGKSEDLGLHVFYTGVIRIEFPSNYPEKPPRFLIEDERHISADSASHDHHRYSGGWMCILADSGDWDSRQDTLISGLNAAFDWILWHYNKFSW